MEKKKWFVGVDWATQAHAVCVLDDAGKVLGERTFKHSGDGLGALANWLETTSTGTAQDILVAIEVPHGPVVETLLERGFQVYAINPKQLDRFRDRFTVAGAKDDRRDARVLADSLRTDLPCFRALSVDCAAIIQLREYSRMAEVLVEQRVRETNRVRQILGRYFPQILELDDELWSPFFRALWELVPTPKAAARVRETTIAKLLIEHRIRRFDAKKVLTVLRQKALAVAPGTTEACEAHLRSLMNRIAILVGEHAKAIEQIEALTRTVAAEQEKSERRDVEILHSMPGVGQIILATLLTEGSGPLETRDYHALRLLAGVAPVTKQSGKRSVVSMRHGCHSRLRNALYYWAQTAAVFEAKSKATYRALRERGHGHARALRTVADRLLYVACAMLRKGQTYDHERRSSVSARLPPATAPARQTVHFST
jgi:transposase